MRTLNQQNFSDRNKYSEQDVAEYRNSQNEDAILIAQQEAAMMERGKVVVKGLIEKYGFSPDGANRTLACIEQMRIHTARFATPEMEKAALAANEWYWK